MTSLLFQVLGNVKFISKMAHFLGHPERQRTLLSSNGTLCVLLRFYFIMQSSIKLARQKMNLPETIFKCKIEN